MEELRVVSSSQEKRSTTVDISGIKKDCEAIIPNAAMSNSKHYKPFALRTGVLVGISILNLLFFGLAVAASMANGTSGSPTADESSSDNCVGETEYQISSGPGVLANGTINFPPSTAPTGYNVPNADPVTTGTLFQTCPQGYNCTIVSIPCSTAPAPSHFTSFGELSTGAYFVGTYLPTIVAVAYRMLWSVVDDNIKRMEPYQLLAGPGGALAEDSICLRSGHVSSFTALTNGKHPDLLLAAIVAFGAMLSVPLASEALSFKVTGDCAADAGGVNCHPSLRYSRPFAAALAVIAGGAAVIVYVIGYRKRGRRSGVFGDPSCIAATAGLMAHPSVRRRMEGVAPAASRGDLDESLKGSRWRLSAWQLSDSTTHGYGLVVEESMTSPQLPSEPGPTQYPTTKTQYIPVQQSHDGIYPGRQRHRSRSKRRLLTNLQPVLFALVLSVILAVITYYRWTTGPSSGFERFMDSQSVGLRFLWTTVGVLIGTYWKSVDRATRILAPYHRLALGNALAKDTILVTSSSIALTALFSNLRRRHFFPACVSLNAVLADVLTTTLGSVPYSSKSSYTGFLISTYVSQALLGIMILSLAWIVLRKGRFDLPREPDCIAAVMAYLPGSTLLEEFGEAETLTAKDGLRYRGVDLTKKRYRLRTVVDFDGRSREIVDTE